MKKVIILGIFSCLFGVAKAQYIGSQYFHFGANYVTNENQYQAMIGTGKVFKSFRIGANLVYRNLDQDQVKANTFLVSPEFSYYLVKRSKFSFLAMAAGNIGFQKAKTKSDLVMLEKNKSCVYGYQVGIRPEMLFTAKFGMFAEYRFEMLFNSIVRDNNLVGVGFLFYL